MTILILVVACLLMLGAPVVATLLVWRGTRAPLWIWAVGAATFVFSQVLHLPFNWLVLKKLDLLPAGNLWVLAAFLGLSSGAFEEVGRWLCYRFALVRWRSWGDGLMLGAGHGGTEALIVGGLFMVNVLALGLVHYGGLPPALVAPGKEATVEVAVLQLFGEAKAANLLGGVERVFAVCMHLGMSVMVLQCFRGGGLRWLLYSILFHAAANASVVIVAKRAGIWAAEGAVGLFAVVAVVVVFWLRGRGVEAGE